MVMMRSKAYPTAATAASDDLFPWLPVLDLRMRQNREG
jgi:hypothetical protein